MDAMGHVAGAVARTRRLATSRLCGAVPNAEACPVGTTQDEHDAMYLTLHEREGMRPSRARVGS